MNAIPLDLLHEIVVRCDAASKRQLHQTSRSFRQLVKEAPGLRNYRHMLNCMRYLGVLKHRYVITVTASTGQELRIEPLLPTHQCFQLMVGFREAGGRERQKKIRAAQKNLYKGNLVNNVMSYLNRTSRAEAVELFDHVSRVCFITRGLPFFLDPLVDFYLGRMEEGTFDALEAWRATL